MMRWFLIGLLALTFIPAEGAAQTDGESQILLAKKKKRKKRKRAEEPAFGPEGIAPMEDDGGTGVGIHREQEGHDAPYFAEIALLTNISLLNTEFDKGDADPVQSTNYSVDVQWLFILGLMQIGPDFSYRSETLAISSTSAETDGNTTITSAESTTSEFSIGGLFKLNLADLDRSTTVIFAYGGVGYRASETTVGEADPLESSGILVKAGGGMNIFMDSNVAFNPRVEFRYSTDQNDSSEEAPVATTTGLVVLVGVGVFI